MITSIVLFAVLIIAAAVLWANGIEDEPGPTEAEQSEGFGGRGKE